MRNPIDWYVDAAFAIHPDFRCHTGATMNFKDGKGAVISVSAKQKLNTTSSTTAELVAVDQVVPLILWVLLFLEEQGYKVENNVMFPDNTSMILLERNGKSGLDERTCTLNIWYFVITNQVEKGHIVIEHCPT